MKIAMDFTTGWPPAKGRCQLGGMERGKMKGDVYGVIVNGKRGVMSERAGFQTGNATTLD